MEGVDLDLVKLIDLATPDSVIGLADQPLHASAELHPQWLSILIREAPK
jgi:hypothetical protein